MDEDREPGQSFLLEVKNSRAIALQRKDRYAGGTHLVAILGRLYSRFRL